MITTATALHHDLEALQDDYTYRVNLLLDEGREDLAGVLAEQYIADAATLMRRAADEPVPA